MKRMIGLITCLVMMVGLMTVNLNAKGGHDHQTGSGTHVDVRVDGGTLTFITKENNSVISTKTVDVTVESVRGTINDNVLSFQRKTGLGIENEWRAPIGRDLNPASDVVTLEFTVKGKAPDDSLEMTVTKTYSGEDVMKAWILNCPGSDGKENAVSGNVGYDIDFESTDLQELFTVDLTVNKEWREDTESIRPESIDVQLYANGVPYDEKVTLSAAGQWTYTFTDLPKYGEDKTEIVYTVQEVNVPDGYESIVNGMVITNTFHNTRVISVTKVWDDEDNADELRPDSVTVELIANENKTGTTAELSENNQWTAYFEVPIYREGETITYTVVENDIPEGYTAEVSGEASTGFTITNTHVVEQKPDVPEEPEIEEPEGPKEPEIEEPEAPEVEESKKPERPETPVTEDKTIPDTSITGSPRYAYTAMSGVAAVMAGMFMLVMAGKKHIQ
ncbi:MAG: Cna B-type domain-containing protein [Bulleidia sp.]